MPVDPKDYTYDVIVIGAGHAGIEAALVAAKMGQRVLMMAINLDSVAWTPCNPAIGGPAKGVVVREIDALGGFMAVAADQAAINLRMLNTSKGAAVRALRAQIDKYDYSRIVKRALEQQPRLRIVNEIAVRILTDSGCVTGVLTHFGVEYRSRAVIIASGTFLGGRIFIGQKSFRAGRMGEFPAEELSVSLRELGLKMGRFKTGTPARISAKTINFSEMERQGTSQEPLAFSYSSTPKVLADDFPCWLTKTNPSTHSIIRRDLKYSPLYGETKLIHAVGPRYCPSIEDKVMRFPSKESHQLFVEPEGRETDEYYVNGLSTSLPQQTQREFVQTIDGLQNAEIVRPAYAVEYDYVLPQQLFPTLESKVVENLYFAGQVNGTSGYEEAAAQGLVAGINASAKLTGGAQLILKRSEAYIGVLIDDLVTRGVDEPYRLLTSRAEYRLLIRHDNAHLRLSHHGYEYGLVDREFYERVENARSQVDENIERLNGVVLKPTSALNNVLVSRGTTPIYQSVRFAQLLKRPEIGYRDLETFDSLPIKNSEIREQVETLLKYEGYLGRLEDEVKRFNQMEDEKIPDGTDFRKVPNLSNEAIEKLTSAKPASMGQAMRIPGITPADVMNLSVYIRSQRRTAIERNREK